MAVKIRLKRMGKKRQPSYRVVIADGRSPRDGRFIEQIGRYDPLTEPSVVEIDNDRALEWLSKGAQPTDAARKLLEISGAWSQFRASKGEVHTIGEAAPPPAKVKKSKKQKAAEAAGAEEGAAAETADAETADAETADAAAAVEESAKAETAAADDSPAETAAAPEDAAAAETERTDDSADEPQTEGEES